MNLREQIVRIWIIVYDGDADRCYTFTNFEKALASVEGSVRCYFGDFGDESQELDVVCDQVMDKMRELQNSPCIPMKFNNLQVVVYNWELDSQNPIHKVLVDAHAIGDQQLKNRIEGLFSPSVR